MPFFLEDSDLSAKSLYTSFRYFKNKEWYKEYLKKDAIRKITTSILAGENVIITPPEVKDFSFLLFQPVFGKNGKPELIR
jgi:hypothetical protein